MRAQNEGAPGTGAGLAGGGRKQRAAAFTPDSSTTAPAGLSALPPLRRLRALRLRAQFVELWVSELPLDAEAAKTAGLSRHALDTAAADLVTAGLCRLRPDGSLEEVPE